jgi:hypothetical protein
MTDFTRVLLTDKIAWELFGLAARERMLYSSDAAEILPTLKRGVVSQRALAFLVLFDNVIIHDFSNGAFHTPNLEGNRSCTRANHAAGFTSSRSVSGVGSKEGAGSPRCAASHAAVR